MGLPIKKILRIGGCFEDSAVAGRTLSAEALTRPQRIDVEIVCWAKRTATPGDVAKPKAGFARNPVRPRGIGLSPALDLSRPQQQTEGTYRVLNEAERSPVKFLAMPRVRLKRRSAPNSF